MIPQRTGRLPWFPADWEICWRGSFDQQRVCGNKIHKREPPLWFTPYAAVFRFHRRFDGLIAEIAWKGGKLEIICEWSKRLYRTKGEKL